MVNVSPSNWARKSLIFLISGLIISNLFFTMLMKKHDVFVLLYGDYTSQNWIAIFGFYLFLCEALGWMAFKSHVIWDFITSILFEWNQPNKDEVKWRRFFTWSLLVIFPTKGADYFSRKILEHFSYNKEELKKYIWSIEMHIHSFVILLIIKVIFAWWWYIDPLSARIWLTILTLWSTLWITPLIALIILKAFPSRSKNRRAFWVDSGMEYELQYLMMKKSLLDSTEPLDNEDGNNDDDEKTESENKAVKQSKTVEIKGKGG